MKRDLRSCLVCLALLPLLLGVDLLQSKNRETETGNARMKAGKAEEALGDYDKAASKLSNDPGVQFNRGTALYALKRYEDAQEAFLRATEAKERERKAQAFYNLGNSFYAGNKWKEAVGAFKKALTYDPADVRAKWNLELALRKKQEEDKKEQQNKDQKGDDKNQGEKDKEAQKQDDKGDDKGDKSKEDQKQPPPPKDDKQAKQDEEQQKPQPGPDKKPEAPPSPSPTADKPPDKDQKPSPDPRELEAILDNLEKSPKSLEQELARLRAAQRRPPAKDW